MNLLPVNDIRLDLRVDGRKRELSWYHTYECLAERMGRMTHLDTLHDLQNGQSIAEVRKEIINI